jgi:hypothetical protein
LRGIGTRSNKRTLKVRLKTPRAANCGPLVLSAGAIGGGAIAGAGIAAFAAAAVGGAVGSIASQGMNMAAGYQDQFSWKQVGISALGAGLGSTSLAGTVSSTVGGGYAGAITAAAVGNVATQGIAKATGLQDSFSWRSVAASAITAGVTQGVGDALGGGAGWQNSSSLSDFGKFAIDAGSRFIGGTVAQVVTAKGGKISVGQVAADAFGNALGNSIAQGIASSGSQQAAKASSYGNWPDQTDAESARLARSGNAYGHWPDQTGAETARLAMYEDMARPTPEASQAAFRQMERDYRQATDTGALIRRGDRLETLAGGSKEMMGRYASGMGLRNMNELPLGQRMVANWNMSAQQAVAKADQFYYTDGLQKTAASMVPAGATDPRYTPPAGSPIAAGVNQASPQASSGVGDQRGNGIAPRDHLLDEARSSGNPNELAIQNYNSAKILANAAKKLYESGGDGKVAKQYLDAALNYQEAGDAARANANSSKVYSSVPRSTGLVLTPGSSPFSANWNTGEYSAGVAYPQGNRSPDYVSIQGGLYVASGGVSINLHNGDVYGQWSLGRSYPAYSLTPNVSVVAGYINGGPGAADTNEFLGGGSAQASAFVPTPVPFLSVGGGVNHSYGGRTAVEIGISALPGGQISPAGYGFELKPNKLK